MARIRGFAIRGLMKYINHARAEATDGKSLTIEQLLAMLSDDHQELFRHEIRHPQWYSYEAYASLLAIVDRELGRGDLTLMREIGRFAALHEGAAPFEFLSTFGSVGQLLASSAPLWKKYCDAGRFELEEVRSGRGIAVLGDFPQIAPQHCHLLAGWIEGMGFAAGAKSCEVEKMRCVHRGDADCAYGGSWSQ